MAVIESRHTLDEYMQIFGTPYQNGELWDFLIEDVESGAIDLEANGIYWVIGDRIFETGMEIEL